MADIRIKDLTTTASSTASDDFIAVDGTTNGTRKLNAFSPTFGGNVVVTGTLTSQSTLSTSAGLSCQNADITGGYITLRGYGDQNGGLIFLGQSSNNNYILSNASTIATVIANTGITDVVAAGLRVKATTASTTTSSGALVVSGGVGVAKSLNVGEAVTVAGGSFAAASFYKSASLGTVLSGATGSSYDLYLTNPAGNYVMQVPTGTRNAEFAATLTTVGAITSGASISTSAPAGGAGAWELGTYSSTAPSATGYVTIEIGGTVYKLLASNV